MSSELPPSQLNVRSMDHGVKPYEKFSAEVAQSEMYAKWGNIMYDGNPENIYTSEAVIEDWFAKPLRETLSGKEGVVRIADFGGASGATLDIIRKQLSPAELELYNVDINSDAALRGTKDGKSHIVSNLGVLPIADESFDAGYSRSVIQYNPLSSETIKTQGDILKELYRVLKPGGTLVLTWPGAKNKETLSMLNEASSQIESYIMRVSTEGILKQKCYTDPETLRELAVSAGFEVIEASQVLELPTTVEAYFDRFGEVIQRNGGDFDGLLKVYTETLNQFGTSLNTGVINDKATLIWAEYRLILRK